MPDHDDLQLRQIEWRPEAFELELARYVLHEPRGYYGQQIRSGDNADDGQKRRQIERRIALCVVMGEGAFDQLLGKKELLRASKGEYCVAFLEVGFKVQMRADSRMIGRDNAAQFGLPP